MIKNLVLSFLLLFISTVLSRSFTVRDLVKLERLGEPIPNSLGTSALFTKWKYDTTLNLSGQSIWSVDTELFNISAITTLTYGVTDSDPVWLDESNVAFISTRSGSSQVWVTNVYQTSNVYQLTNYPLGVSNLKVFNSAINGKNLAFVIRVYHDKSIQQTYEIDVQKEKETFSGLTYDSLYFRHWTQFNDLKYNHIFVVPISFSNGRYYTLEQPRDLMFGYTLESPVLPFGGNSDFDFSPDGTELAFVSYKPGVDVAWGTNMDIYTVSIYGGTGPKDITADNLAQDSYPVYSYDGLYIAFLSMTIPKNEADRRRVVLYDRQTGLRRTLTENWDRSPESIAWSLDSRYLYVTAQDFAKEKVFEITVNSGLISILVGYAYNSGIHVTPRGLVFNQNTQNAPSEIFTHRNGINRQITFINRGYFSDIELNQPEEFWFNGTLGDQIHGWLIKPPGFNQGLKYPVAFLIHGGPQSAWLDNFSFRWNPQLFAAAGFVVVAIDPHGSTSYGQKFCEAINGEWGSYPYEDLMIGFDYIVKNYNFIDPTRIAGLGASYGGYMVNWINGHTNRFVCLVNHAGLFDTQTMYYTTEELFFPEYDFRGTPWESSLYQKWNPSNYVTNMVTPTLVIHGALDYRVVDGHGFSTFTSLQRRGIKSRLLYFPDEGHWILKPGNIIKWYDEVLGWISEFTAPKKTN